MSKLKLFLCFSILIIFSSCHKSFFKDTVSETSAYYENKNNDYSNYIDSEEVTFDSEHEYLKEIFDSAQKGDAYSINYIGKLYYDGDFLEKDYKKAFKWFQKGAELGEASSQYNLGWLYEKGEGVNVDLDKALKFYSMSAEQNYPKGICALAYMNYNGYGKNKNYDEAYKLFLKAAGGFDSDAMSNIASMYMDGKGLEKNIDMAYLWYKISADNDIGSYSSNLLFQNKEHNYIKNLIKNFSNSTTIPDSLIIEAQEYILSSQLYNFLKKYSTQSNICTDDFKNNNFKFTKDFEDTIIEKQIGKWYCVDINNDGKEEFVFFNLEGSMGISTFKVFTQNENGEFNISENTFEAELWYGINDIIKYKDNYYFVIIFQDYSFHYPSYMEIYSFDGIKLNDCITIKNSIDLKNMNYIKTYQNKNFYLIEKFIDSQIQNILEYTVNKQFVYTGDEHKLNENELKKIGFFIDKSDNIYCSDINNDGIDEYFYKSIWLPSSINGQNNLTFDLYGKSDDKYTKIDNIIDYINDKYIYGYLQQLFIKKFDNENYIFMLNQKEKSKNFNLCVYKLNGDKSQLIMSYLISFPFSDININIKDNFNDL